MFDALFWIYLINSVLLITHEIDSAYWKEWELFKLPGGAGGFMALHLPLVFIVMYGFYQVSQETLAGLIISLILGLGGIFAFTIHTWFIKKGQPQFKTPVSLGILTATLAVSIAQAVITVYLLAT
jgi:hypothetical protein